MHATISVKKQEERVSALREEIDALKSQLGENEDAKEIVANHIKLLHKYNEVKDATQVLIGRLASLKQTTVKQIHMNLDLPLDD